VQYDSAGGNGAAGSNDYPYWTEQRHQPMPGPPGSTLMPPHQLGGPSTLEYRPPPRRNYSSGLLHAAAVPGMMDESGLGLSVFHISYELPCYRASEHCIAVR